MVSLAGLVLPILLCSVALFVASFLSWMVFPFHKQDWVKLDTEDQFLEAVRSQNIPPGNYMFPACQRPEEMKGEDYQRKVKEGPMGVLTILPGMSMGRNLSLTLLYFFVVSICLAYLGRLALPPGSEALRVFRFMATAAFVTFLAGMVQHAIWFRARIVGHVAETVAYAVIVGGLFAALWPGG